MVKFMLNLPIYVCLCSFALSIPPRQAISARRSWRAGAGAGRGFVKFMLNFWELELRFFNRKITILM